MKSSKIEIVKIDLGLDIAQEIFEKTKSTEEIDMSSLKLSPPPKDEWFEIIRDLHKLLSPKNESNTITYPVLPKDEILQKLELEPKKISPLIQKYKKYLKSTEWELVTFLKSKVRYYKLEPKNESIQNIQ